MAGVCVMARQMLFESFFVVFFFEPPDSSFVCLPVF